MSNKLIKGISHIKVQAVRGKDGKDAVPPSKDELVSLMKPLIPAPVKGDRGNDGTDGAPGRAGKDGVGKDGKSGKDGTNGKDGQAGLDGSPDTPDQVVEKVNQATQKIDSKQVKGLNEVISEVARIGTNPGGGGGRTVRYLDEGVEASAYVTELNFGTGLSLSYAGDGRVTITGSAGGGTPGGSDTQIQFNDGGSFGGDADFTWDSLGNDLKLGTTSNTKISFGGYGLIRTTGDGSNLALVATDGTGGGSIILSSGNATNGNGGNLDLAAGGGVGVGNRGGNARFISGSGDGIADAGDVVFELGPGNGAADGKLKINPKAAGIYGILNFNSIATTDKIFTFPNNTGTIALLSDITGINSGTNTGDNAVNTLYSGLVSNATHTGDAEGATTLTVKRINGVALSGLATGILKNTTTTGVPSIAVNSDLPAMTATVGGAVPTPPNNTTTFLRGDGTFAAPVGGAGDMVLASAQTNSGVKTFLDTTMKLRNVANTFDGYFVNTNTANRIYTLKDAAGTLAFVSDITGTNSGTNTGDQTITLTGDVAGSGTGSFATTLATVNAAVGSFGLAGSIAQFTVNAKGLITTAANVAISITASQVSDFAATVRSTVLTGLSLVSTTVIAATDTILVALGSLQAQITALTTTVGTKAPNARLINTTAPLAGGGDLSADRTLTTSMNTNKLIGRGTAAVGVMEEITLGTNLSFTGTTLNAAGGGTATVQDEAVTQSTTVTTFNFIGAGVTASGAGATATINIPGGAGDVSKIVSSGTSTVAALTSRHVIRSFEIAAGAKLEIEGTGSMLIDR